MQLTALFPTLAIFATSSLAAATSGSFATSSTYDNYYDNPLNSLNGVACSNGANGLVTKGFTTFNTLPSFPHIGGAQAVESWNSTNCGTCWALTFGSKTINVLAVDHAANGFNIAQTALDELTGGKAVQIGRVDITAKQVPESQCGL
ncbi:hypothetical protein M422DRAFT_187205 [Sphaerobolus stellatus SS14]|uniref:Cerato-platanin n=1 Tax=Sphaerobolus stellatus (strain SS14) TaxID=990650 RepID=A0A0C9UZB9_SPHS4|nr:hypothetical protein M422DRAFT_187205 [Sphaerobolus stellatus SS14]